MKLELKYLASYLPYSLKGIDEVNNYYSLYSLDSRMHDFDLWIDENFQKFSGLGNIKPILFPLSALTKEMYYKLSAKNENDDFGFFYGKNNGDFDKRDYIYRQGYSGKTYMLEDGYCQFPYEMMDFFFKNKFDVFGLIDAGLAEPVTEDFNPYK